MEGDNESSVCKWAIKLVYLSKQVGWDRYMARLSDAMIQIKNLEEVPTEDEINEFMNNILVGGNLNG